MNGTSLEIFVCVCVCVSTVECFINVINIKQRGFGKDAKITQDHFCNQSGATANAWGGHLLQSER